MIIEKHISFVRLFAIIWKRIFKMFLLSAVIVTPIVFFNLYDYTIDLTAPLILGTALSIFLGFRTNSAYERWSSARGFWSAVMSSGRNMGLILARIDEAYTNNKTGKPSKAAAEVMPRMLCRTMAWAWALNRQLKDLPPLQDLDKFLDAGEVAALRNSHNPALEMLFSQSRDFRIAQSEGQFFDGEHFEVIAIQREMVAAQTSCEGLKNTPFPTHYTFFTDVFIWLLIVLLSVSLPKLENMGYFAIPSIVLIGWIFTMIEGIGTYMDDPFVNNRNVIPMDTLARNLEIDLMAIALDSDDVPPPIDPIDGALY